MADEMELAAAGSTAARAALDQMLVALQAALRRAMAHGPATADEPDFWADLDRAYAAYDAYLAHVIAAHPARCQRGCDACCHDNPRGVAGVEQLRLARAIEAAGRIEEVRPRVAAAAAAYAAARQEHGDLEAAEGQRARHRPCPLLGADGACTVYPSRPVACRMFFAFTPPEWCVPTHPRFLERQNPNLVPPLVCRQILGAISQCLGRPSSTNLWEGLADALSTGAVARAK